jgi:hypothetical protein
MTTIRGDGLLEHMGDVDVYGQYICIYIIYISIHTYYVKHLCVYEFVYLY